MPVLQPGQNCPLPEGRLVISIDGEPADTFIRQTRSGAFLLDAGERAADSSAFVSDDQPRAGDALIYDPAGRRLQVDLTAVPATVERISIVLLIRSGQGRGVTFSTFGRIALRLTAGATELEFVLPSLNRGETALIVGQCYRHRGQWKFRAVGQGFAGGLKALGALYGLTLHDPGPDPAPVPRPAPTPPGSQFSGTGFCVNAEGYFVTNHHVIDGAVSIEARSPRNRYRLTPVFSDPTNDLALLKADERIAGVAAFRAGPAARLGESVVAIGYPLGGILGSSPQVTTGNVSSLIGLRDDTRTLQFTAPVQSGNSGGPLLDHDGTIIGVVCAKLDAARIHELTGDVPQNVNFAIKSALVQSFLDAVGVEYRLKPWERARNPAEIAAEAQGYVVRIECQG